MKQLLPKEQFATALLQLAGGSVWTVFEDFLDYSLLCFRWWGVQENKFAALKQKYTTSQMQLLLTAFKAMGQLAGQDGVGFTDPFGDFYMEHLSNHRKGQFFTPSSVCTLVSELLTTEETPDTDIFMDPCCGSGQLVLSTARHHRHALYFSIDVDLICCKMTLLNYLLNAICGEIAWMDTLTLQHHQSWHVKKVLDGSYHYLAYYFTTEAGKTHLFTNNLAGPNDGPAFSSFYQTKILKQWKQQQSR